MKRKRVKNIIFNPVLKVPWVPEFGNKIPDVENFALNLSLQENEAHDMCIKKKILRKRPLRPTKAVLTRKFTEQLKPNYPNFNKTHVKAALQLTDNNLDQTKLVLDLKGKFEKITKIRKGVHLLEASRREVNNVETQTSESGVFSTMQFRTSARNSEEIQAYNSPPQIDVQLESLPVTQPFSAISSTLAFNDSPPNSLGFNIKDSKSSVSNNNNYSQPNENGFFDKTFTYLTYTKVVDISPPASPLFDIEETELFLNYNIDTQTNKNNTEGEFINGKPKTSNSKSDSNVPDFEKLSLNDKEDFTPTETLVLNEIEDMEDLERTHSISSETGLDFDNDKTEIRFAESDKWTKFSRTSNEKDTHVFNEKLDSKEVQFNFSYSEKSSVKKEEQCAVYEFSDSETKTSCSPAPTFFQWRLSSIGASKIKLKRNKIGVLILKNKDGYISHLL